MSAFGEIYTTGKKFCTAGGSDGSDKSHLWVISYARCETAAVLFIENMYTYFVYIQVIVITLLKKEKGRILKYSGDDDIIIRGWQQRKEGVFIKTYQQYISGTVPKMPRRRR